MTVGDESVQVQESEELIDGVLHVIRRTISTKVERISSSNTIKTIAVEIPYSEQTVTSGSVLSIEAVPVPEAKVNLVHKVDAEPLPEAEPEFVSLSEPLPFQQESVSADQGNVEVQETEEYIDGIRHITRRVISTTVNEGVASIELPPPEPVIQPETVSKTELEVVTFPAQIPEPIIEPELENVNKENVEIHETEEYIDGVRHVIRRVISTKVTEQRIPVPEPEAKPVVVSGPPGADVTYEYVTTSGTTFMHSPETVPEPVVVSGTPGADVTYEYVTTTGIKYMHSPEKVPEPVVVSRPPGTDVTHEYITTTGTTTYIHSPEKVPEPEAADLEDIAIHETSDYVNININQEITSDNKVPTPEPEVNLEHDHVNLEHDHVTLAGNSSPTSPPKCRCLGPSGGMQESVLADNQDGTYTADITASEPGVHTVNVEYDGKLIPGSPFIVRIMQAPDTKKVRMYGTGLESGLLGNFQDLFHVDTTGAGPGDLRVRVHGPKDYFKVDLYRDLPSDRVINIKYSPSQIGIYTVNVYWSGEHVAGSPNELYICENHEQLTKWYDDHDQVREEEGLINKN